MWHHHARNTSPTPDLYKRLQFPAEIISHYVWLYYRFSLLSYEGVRHWCRKLGQTFANALRRCRPRLWYKWPLDEVFLTIKDERHCLWRTVDQEGTVLDILVQRRRDMNTAKKFFWKLFKSLMCVLWVMITDKLNPNASQWGKGKYQVIE